jgi:hypothetical protein
MMPLYMTPSSIHHVVDPRSLSYVLLREVGESNPPGPVMNNAYAYDSAVDPPCRPSGPESPRATAP